MSELPPGFALDQAGPAPQQLAAGLPDGFVVDNASPPSGEKPKFGLGDTWPAKLAKAVGAAVQSGFTLPGDVMAGRVDPGSDETIRRSVDLATIASPASPAAGTGKLIAREAGLGKPPSAPPPAAPAAVVPEGVQVAQAAERLNVDIPRAVTSDKTSVQQIGKIATNIPIGGTPLRNASREAIEQLGAKADEVQAGYGSGSIPNAGATVREGLERYIGKETQDRANALYSKVDEVVDPTITRPLVKTFDVARQIEGRRDLAGLDSSSAVAHVLNAVNRPEGLTYEGIKQLRSSVGEMLKSGPLPAGLSQSEMKQIYSSLTSDLEGTVRAAGGERAASMFSRANKYYGLVSERRESLARVLKANSDEAVFDKVVAAAGSTGRADISLLAQARKALQPDEWNEVASGVISRLGRDAEQNFSPDRFVTAYGKLTDAGKSMLFSGQKELKSSLDDIAKVSSRFKMLNQYANPSGTGQTVAGVAGLGGIMTDPVSLITSVVSARVMSGILAKPQSAKAVANFSRAYESAVKMPAIAAKQFLARETQKFSASIARELGAPRLANDLSRSLQGAIYSRADDENPEAQRGRNN